MNTKQIIHALIQGENNGDALKEATKKYIAETDPDNRRDIARLLFERAHCIIDIVADVMIDGFIEDAKRNDTRKQN